MANLSIKASAMENRAKIKFQAVAPNKLKLVVVDDHEIVIDGEEVYVVRKSQFPKTYEECCSVLKYEPNEDVVSCYRGKLIESFVKLLICRDAYWKIAGDWKPNWEDETDIYYTISYDGVNIKCYNNTDVYSKLAFPTAEMRDAFNENFIKDIEFCKELL